VDRERESEWPCVSWREKRERERERETERERGSKREREREREKEIVREREAAKERERERESDHVQRLMWLKVTDVTNLWQQLWVEENEQILRFRSVYILWQALVTAVMWLLMKTCFYYRKILITWIAI
jgi:hypothetical protein